MSIRRRAMASSLAAVLGLSLLSSGSARLAADEDGPLLIDPSDAPDQKASATDAEPVFVVPESEPEPATATADQGPELSAPPSAESQQLLEEDQARMREKLEAARAHVATDIARPEEPAEPRGAKSEDRQSPAPQPRSVMVNRPAETPQMPALKDEKVVEASAVEAEELPAPRPVARQDSGAGVATVRTQFIDRLGLGVTESQGQLQVARVVEGSVAEAAGVRRGDRLLSLNGRSAGSAAQLQALLASSTLPQSTPLLVLRGSDQRRLIVEFPSQPRPAVANNQQAPSQPTYHRTSVTLGAYPQPATLAPSQYRYYGSNGVATGRVYVLRVPPQEPVYATRRAARTTGRVGILGRLLGR